MWEISPTLVRYDVTEPTSVGIASVGLKALAVKTAGAKISGAPYVKPISNFYQTDPISRKYVYLPQPIVCVELLINFNFTFSSVTMAQCTRAFVNGEDFDVGSVGQEPAAAFA